VGYSLGLGGVFQSRFSRASLGGGVPLNPLDLDNSITSDLILARGNEQDMRGNPYILRCYNPEYRAKRLAKLITESNRPIINPVGQDEKNRRK